MATKKNTTRARKSTAKAAATATEEAPKRRGRPANFPNVETTPFGLGNFPVETQNRVRTLSEQKGIPVPVLVRDLIDRAFNAANKRSAKKA